MSGPEGGLGLCRRLLPYQVHEMRSAGGRRCERPAVDMLGPEEFGQEARCAVHRGADLRRVTMARKRVRAAMRRRSLLTGR